MSKLSIIIPSYNEPYLGRTVRDLLKKAKGDIEIFVHIDGDMPKKLVKDKRVNYAHHQKPIGMRGGTNLALEKTKSKFIMKTDAHCVFAKGFDEVLKRDCKENWLMIPRRYSLNSIEWDRSLESPVKDYHYLCYPQPWRQHKFCMVPVVWKQKTRERFKKPEYNIDDTMTFQGSCWFANKKYFMEKVGFLDKDKYGSFGGEQVEIGLKYWLGGGEVKVNKNTWYAHLFKGSGFYKSNRKLWRNKQILLRQANYEWISRHWVNNKEPKMKHKFSWLLEKFWPVPGWPKQKIMESVTPLCKIAEKYGSDKCPQYKHGYTPYYYDLLKNKRNKIKKVIEMGIGGFEVLSQKYKNYYNKMGRVYEKGPGLKMWRDFFPNAIIYGADINSKTMFKDERIETFVCNERNKEDINRLLKKTGYDIDLFIDDALHTHKDQLYLTKTVIPLLQDSVIYVIENVSRPKYIVDNLSDYACEVVICSNEWRDDKLIVVRKGRRGKVDEKFINTHKS